MTLPDLYLVGAPKAGTTSVAGWLASHPEVFWSTPKEPYHWAGDYPRLRAHYGFERRANYEQLFDSAVAEAAAVRAEGSTVYLYSTEAVPSILREVQDAKFVVCVRDPVDLVVSYHRTQLVALNEDQPDFDIAWERSLRSVLPRTDPLDAKLVDYQQVGRLGLALERLLESAARSRVHVIFFDDLVAEPDRTWGALAAFVGVDSTHRPEFEVRNRSDKAYRSAVVRRLTHRPPAPLEAPMRRLRQWTRTTSLPGVLAAKQRMWRQAPRPSVEPEVREQLAAYFRGDVDRLAALTQRDLSHWAVASQQRR